MIPTNSATVRIWPRQDVAPVPWPGKPGVTLPIDGADIVWSPRWLALHQAGVIHLHDPAPAPAPAPTENGG